MRIPRDIDAKQFTVILKKYGYSVTRQTGSHIRLTSNIKKRKHHVTVPAHNPLRVGTLSAVITDIAQYMGKSKQDVIVELFYNENNT